ncbi:MAG TPA: heme o synthase [Thermoanaerobaculia bacterium]|jgi:protoheme IX farnesyltransferase|nr:heme o synthase [Thermoanaerobaculia bacterium]
MSSRPLAAAQASGRVRPGDFVTLAKLRVNTLVLVTTALGYLLARRTFDAWTLFHAILGTGLVAASAAAFNQIWERDLDAKMRRTAQRPLAAGRMEVAPAALFAFTLAFAGLAQLSIGVNLLSAAIAAATLLLYVLVYTPMKRVTSLATIVGAVPGALPPVIGWAAAGGGLAPGAWVLFAILFFWQMPHFLSIAWLYRADYARAGFPMLPVIEPDGASTGRQAALYAATLVPVSLALSTLRVTGPVYSAGAVVCGIAFSAAAVVFALRRTTASARWLFAASILYLPALLLLAFLDGGHP